MIVDAIASLFTPKPVPVFRNASIENPAFSLDSPEAYDLLTAGYKSAAGIRVSHQDSLRLAAVWQALSLISGDVAKLPNYPYKRMSDDEREIDDKHRAYFATSIRANRYKEAFLFWRDLMVHALLWNNGYGYISWVNGKAELYNLLPDRTAPEWVMLENGTRSELVYVTEVSGQLVTLMPQQVLHIRGLSIDGNAGSDLVAFAKDTWGLALSAQNFSSKFFKNGARMGGILELPAATNKPARDTIEEGFRKSYEEGDNPFKTVILREGAKFHAGQVTPEQGQVVDLRDVQKREAASYFNIPPSKLGIRDSVSYNSFEQDNLSYLHGCLHHWLATIEAQCNMKLLTEEQLQKDTHYFEHNVSKFIQADWKTLNEGLEIQLRNTVISPNDWRRKLNMKGRPGGDTYENPNVKPSVAPPKTEEKPKKLPVDAHRALFVDTLNRVARRVGHDARKSSANTKAFQNWLDDGANEHRVVFDQHVRPVMDAYCEVFGGDPVQFSMTAQNEFFGPLITELSELLDPPHTAADLQANVDKGMKYFERFAGERVANAILEAANG